MFRRIHRFWRQFRRWWRGQPARQAGVSEGGVPLTHPCPPAPAPEAEPTGVGVPKVEPLEGDRVLAILGVQAWLMSSREARRLALRLIRGAALARKMARWDAHLADGECLGK